MFKRALLCISGCVLFSMTAYGREGFGFTKKAADMNRTVPPAINVVGNKVTVIVDADRSRVLSRAQTLRQAVESSIVAADKNLTAAPNGDFRIVIALDRLETDRIAQSKVEDNYEKTKDSKGKTKYENHPTTKSYTTVRADIGGTYKVLDSEGRLLDQGDIDRHYNEDFEYGAPLTSKIEDGLLDWAANRIASRVVPTHVRTKVLLPKGSFEQYIPLAESGAWDRYLQSVQSVRPLNDRASDAYREYALGVAYEGSAYAAADPKEGLDLIRKAAEHYRTAAANNPSERIFSEAYNSLLSSAAAPIQRADESIKAYEAWTSGPTKASSMASAATTKTKSIRNQQIIDMTKAGLAEDNILLAIDNASATDFDTTPEALIALSTAGVTKKVIAAMQKR